MTTFLSSSLRAEDPFGPSRSAESGKLPKPPERQREELKEACQHFEGILLSMLWKDMMRTAREMGDGSRRPFAPLEDTAVEMASQSLSESGGVGLWKVLYDQLQESLPAEEGKGAPRGLRG